MKKLAKTHPDKLLDLLCERLTFERSGVQLYDAILAKMTKSKAPKIKDMLPQMKEHRDQEKEHEEWLEEQIRALGGDTEQLTEMAKLTKAESVGIENVILDGDPKIPHLFHALLAAELVDNTGWELLCDLAEEAGDEDAQSEFEQRLEHEEEHLELVKQAVEMFAIRDLLGEDVPAPTGP